MLDPPGGMNSTSVDQASVCFLILWAAVAPRVGLLAGELDDLSNHTGQDDIPHGKIRRLESCVSHFSEDKPAFGRFR